MDTMKAVRMHDYGGPEVLVYEDVPWPPPPRGDQVLVRVAAAGVGPWDGAVRRGEWRGMIDHPLPLILGLDLSGTVAAIGPDARGVRVGEEVYGVADMTLSGSNAAYALGHAANLAPKPRSLDHVGAAAVPVAAATALQMVRDLARVAPGQTVLVLGAGGGLGAYAVRFAKRAGARVVATAAEGDVAYVRGLGADEVIDFRARRFEEVVMGADAVINPVPDAETAARSYGALRPGGILVLSAVQPDEAAAMRRGVRATFVSGEATTGRLNELAALLDAGAIAPHVGMILPLAEARRAHALLDGAPHPGGKIVLDVLA